MSDEWLLDDDDPNPFGLGDLIAADTEQRKRSREAVHAKFSLGGIGEDDHPEQEIELFIKDDTLEMWKHKTLYCLRMKQDEAANKDKLWVPWKGKDSNGKVVVMARTRDWKPKEPKYQLKRANKESSGSGWKRFYVGGGGGQKRAKTDAERIVVKFGGEEMSLQDALDSIHATIKKEKKKKK